MKQYLFHDDMPFEDQVDDLNDMMSTIINDLNAKNTRIVNLEKQVKDLTGRIASLFNLTSN